MWSDILVGYTSRYSFNSQIGTVNILFNNNEVIEKICDLNEIQIQEMFFL